jgi:peptidoglycan hydrolase CwlO-like protein
MTAAMSKDAAQLLQGVQRLDADVQDLKGRVIRLEGRMDKLESRMERLESSNGQILEQLKRISKTLTEPPMRGQSQNPGELSAYLDTIERRLTALKR